MPCRRAACMASIATSGVVSDKRAEDAAGVKPARALAAEDVVPIDLAGLQLRNRGMAAIRAAERGAHAEAALGEVQAVAHRAAHAVVRHPAHQRLIDAALVDQVLHQTPHRIVGEAR